MKLRTLASLLTIIAVISALSACSGDKSRLSRADTAPDGISLPLPSSIERRASQEGPQLSCAAAEFLAGRAQRVTLVESEQLTFQPQASSPQGGLSSLAFAMFELNAGDWRGVDTLNLDWAAAPQKGSVRIALADFAANRWQWMHNSGAGSAFALENFGSFVEDGSGRVLAIVMVEGGIECGMQGLSLSPAPSTPQWHLINLPELPNSRILEGDLFEVEGHPAIIYVRMETPPAADSECWIEFMRANDPYGSSWGAPVKVSENYLFSAASDFSGEELDHVNCFGQVIDGKPVAIAAIHGPLSPGHGLVRLDYYRALDSLGSSWDDPDPIASRDELNIASGASEVASFIQVEGIPAIAYFDRAGTVDDPHATQAYFIRATDSSGSDWNDPVLVSNGTPTNFVFDCEVLNGYPVMLTQGEIDDWYRYLYYQRASDALGDEWNEQAEQVCPHDWNQDMTGFDPSGFYAHANIDGELYLDANGRPAFMVRGATGTFEHSVFTFNALDALGSSWPTVPVMAMDTRFAPFNEVNWTRVCECPGNTILIGGSYGNGSSMQLTETRFPGGASSWTSPVLVDYPGLYLTSHNFEGECIAGNPAVLVNDHTQDSDEYAISYLTWY